jgi:hypothetical protein
LLAARSRMSLAAAPEVSGIWERCLGMNRTYPYWPDFAISAQN